MSDCGVCLSGGCEGGEGFFMVTRTAKSVRVCCECGDKIPAGTPYEFAGYGYDGKRSYHITCQVCAEIAWAFFCDVRMYEGLWESMDDVWDDLTVSCFNKLKTPAAKAELQRRWMQHKGLAA